MPVWIALVGALFFTFLASRLYLRLTHDRLFGTVRLLVAHVASLATCGLIAALVKANQELLNESAVLIYVVPQLLWLSADWYAASGRARR
jgi:hypothetical protein